MTSSNTGVPDISGSVYNKTQVSDTGPSSLVRRSRPMAVPAEHWWLGLLPGWLVSGSAAMTFLTLALFAVGEESRSLSHQFCHVIS